uniref:Uncharacterized protein n=1 Tax=Glossina pallidipes TaxID=7398 RepID=A0A1A9ZK60_GLOPL
MKPIQRLIIDTVRQHDNETHKPTSAVLCWFVEHSNVVDSVRLGEWDTTTNPDYEFDIRGNKNCAPEHLDVAVESAIPHPMYAPNSRNQLHDIALLHRGHQRNLAEFHPKIKEKLQIFK